MGLLLVSAVGALAQSDGDGIPDQWKKSGVDITWPDGRTKHLDLPGLGVKPGRKAVVVWVDWMAAADHTHRPVASTDKFPATPGGAPSTAHVIENFPLERVVRSFDISPVDGYKGVTLAIIWADKISWPDKPFQPIPEQPTLGAAYAGTDGLLHYDWTEFDNLRRSRTGNFGSLFGKGFHYAAFIHQMTGITATGLSKGVPGDEFLISLGVLDDQVGSADDQGGTFMHELGHNLGLDHGGAVDIGYKPNYLSVMNYMFQRVGIANLGMYGHFDYSRSALDDIDESKLNGKYGIVAKLTDSLAPYGTAHVCRDSPPISLAPCVPSSIPPSYSIAAYSLVWKLNCPVDWKCAEAGPGTDQCPSPNTLPGGEFAYDVNGDGCISVLNGFDDWKNLRYWPAPQPGGGEPVRREMLPLDELDGNTPTLLTTITVSKVDVSPVPKGVRVTWSRIPLERVVGYEVLRQGPSGRVSIIRRTKGSAFVDETATPGVRYTYAVRPILAVSGEREASVLFDKVRDAAITKTTILGQRAKKLHLLAPGEELMRGLSTAASQKAPGQ